MQQMPRLITCPFKLIVDTREQAPFHFEGLKPDASQVRKSDKVPPKLIVEIVRKGIPTGDYSIEGLEDEVSVERKSLADLYSTVGQDRKRFVRELERLNEMKFAAVVVEAEWSKIMTKPPVYSKLNPKTLVRSILAWQQRYPSVHWLPMPMRRVAEQITFRT